MELTWAHLGADRTQVGPMLATWTLLSGYMENIAEVIVSIRKHVTLMYYMRQYISHGNYILGIQLILSTKPPQMNLMLMMYALLLGKWI